MRWFPLVGTACERPGYSHAVEFLAEIAEDATEILHGREVDADLTFSRTERNAHSGVQSITEAMREVVEKVLTPAGGGLGA